MKYIIVRQLSNKGKMMGCRRSVLRPCIILTKVTDEAQFSSVQCFKLRQSQLIALNGIGELARRYWLAASSRWLKILSNGVVCFSNIFHHSFVKFALRRFPVLADMGFNLAI
jgi:hypothetical protein